MSEIQANEIRVSVDVGCYHHTVAIGLSTGELLDEFEMSHQAEGFKEFFHRIEAQETRYGLPVAVAMEGYNGYARPLDGLVRARNYRLYNINNLKLARFKEIFAGAAKTDVIDARKGLELFQLRDHLPLAKDVLQEVAKVPKENAHLKRLTRRRRRLVNERVSLINSLQADIQSVCPGLLAITKDVGNVWFLHFLVSADNVRALATQQMPALLKIRGVGRKYMKVIQAWQAQAYFSDEVALVSPMIHEDVQRIIELRENIKQLEQHIDALSARSTIAGLMRSIPGFGETCSAELAGELGTIERFRGESSLALYLGMATLDNASGKYRGTKTPRHVNTRAKAAMMTAVDRHRKSVPESQAYYEKKRREGKAHNQAIRALGRHLCRVIFKMLTQEKIYEVK